MILVDTSGLVAALSPDQDHHDEASRAFREAPEPFLLSPFVLAEIDYFLRTRGNVGVQLRFLAEVSSGGYALEPFDENDVSAAIEVIDRYSDQEISLADASIVILAGRHDTDRILTLDERHFRALRTPAGKPFTILPADA